MQNIPDAVDRATAFHAGDPVRHLDCPPSDRVPDLYRLVAGCDARCLSIQVRTYLGRTRRIVCHSPDAHADYGRATAETRGPIAAGPLTIDLATGLVWVAGSVVDLTPTEWRLLVILAEHAERVVPYERLVEVLWGVGQSLAGGAANLGTILCRVRDKLGREASAHLVTIKGRGLMLTANHPVWRRYRRR